MVNKRGFMRVVESTIAVILILGALVFLSSHREAPKSRDLGTVIPPLLDEIARNLTFREDVANSLDEEIIEEDVKEVLKERLNAPTLNLSVELCNATEMCFLEPYPDTDGDIFSSE
ncbi:MAG: hypothetical protein KKE05_06670, partial [Nanoarchaeota archaeon]|nr:hypothetical protein [Nanoarchaeota archaeon]